MKLVIQRVKSASVSVNGGEPRGIGQGLMVLFCAAEGDDMSLAAKLADKTAKLRIFEDENGKMNRSAAELGLSALVVSNFTLCADTKKGNRPSFTGSAAPAFAKAAYEAFVQHLRSAEGIAAVETGEFGADMQVSLVNDGPVTIIMDTKEWQR